MKRAATSGGREGTDVVMNNTGTLTVTTPTDREIVLRRVFDAPRRMMFDALTKPELLKRWFGARGWNLVVFRTRVGNGLPLPPRVSRTAQAAVGLPKFAPRVGGLGHGIHGVLEIHHCLRRLVAVQEHLTEP